MASAKAFALEMQGEKSFGGSGAPAHLRRIGYQRCDGADKLTLSGPPNVFWSRPLDSLASIRDGVRANLQPHVSVRADLSIENPTAAVNACSALPVLAGRTSSRRGVRRKAPQRAAGTRSFANSAAEP
jgi:hypothetical protein